MTQPSDFQADLFDRRRNARKVINAATIAELCGLLRGRGWLSAKAIEALRPDWDERFVRKLARAAIPKVTSAPGSTGYRLTSEAELEEVEHCGHARVSQGRDMARSGIQLLRVAALRRAERTLTEISPVS